MRRKNLKIKGVLYSQYLVLLQAIKGFTKTIYYIHTTVIGGKYYAVIDVGY